MPRIRSIYSVFSFYLVSCCGIKLSCHPIYDVYFLKYCNTATDEVEVLTPYNVSGINMANDEIMQRAYFILSRVVVKHINCLKALTRIYLQTFT